MVNEYILDAKDEAIINGLDNLFGVVQNKEVLRNIIIFSKLKRDDEINTGNFNIIIRNNSDYNLLEDFLRICTKLFVKNNIIENDYIKDFIEETDNLFKIYEEFQKDDTNQTKMINFANELMKYKMLISVTHFI